MPRLIFVNRYFYPDHSATSQMLSDLAFDLASHGQDVVVVTSRQVYDQPAAQLPSSESVAGVTIERVWTTTFGRGQLLGRAIDYLTFYLSAAWRLFRVTARGDTLIAKTDPPLISVVAALVARLRGARLVNWIQDLFPEVAQALGVKAIRPLAPLLFALRDASLRAADVNVVLGERMAERVAGRGIDRARISIIPNWADGRTIFPFTRADNMLRKVWGLEDKFVIGYSGNMGRAHEFNTLIDSICALRKNSNITFLFIGDGAQRSPLEAEFRNRGITNVQFRPYQPREKLAQSLSVPDVHVVCLRDAVEGLIVPSKIYGIAAAGRAVIFLGDRDGEIARLLEREQFGASVASGNSGALSGLILQWARDRMLVQKMGHRARMAFVAGFDQPIAMQRWRKTLTLGGEQTTLHAAQNPRPHLTRPESVSAQASEKLNQ